MPLKIFGHAPKKIAVDAIGSPSTFQHSFGGLASDHGIVFTNSPPLQLIYCLDSNDPLIPAFVPHTRFLPLLFPFGYDMQCSYSVLDGNKICLHSDLEAPAAEPVEPFAAQPTAFEYVPYDPTNWKDAFSFKGVFGWDDLSEHDRMKAVEYAVETYGITKEEYGPDPDWELEDIVRCMFDPPFAQLTAPLGACGNPACRHDELVVIAFQSECHDSREQIWGNNPYPQTVWQLCEKCRCIDVSNQCS